MLAAVSTSSKGNRPADSDRNLMTGGAPLSVALSVVQQNEGREIAIHAISHGRGARRQAGT